MQKLKLVAVILFMLFSALPSFLFAQSSPDKINMDAGWKFHLGHAAKPDSDFNFKVANLFSKTGKAEHTAVNNKFDDKQWRSLDLPHDWANELPFVYSKNEDVVGHGFKPIGGLFPQNSIGWYRKHFSVNRADSGKRFVLQFDGIFRDSKIWVNGFYLGTHESGYLPVSYDITDYLDYHKENVIVVRADATQSEGWFYEGAGIYRHVWLNKLNNVHITQDGVFVHTTTTGNKSTISVETELTNQGATPQTSTFFAYIKDRTGHIVGKTPKVNILLAVNETKTIKQQALVNNAHLWSIDDPYLYHLVPVVQKGTSVLDQQNIRFGIRTIAIDAAKGLLVNGKSVKVQGTNNHPDHAGVGTALPDYLQYYRIKALKEMGANAYRTSHYAPTPELLDACDSLGMLVLDENRLLSTSPEYMHQFEQLIKRDRSRASVFMWSIGNEEGYVQTTSTGKRIAQTLIEKQKELDPTRTCTYAADMANVFHGINEVIPVRGFNYRQFAVEPYHKDHPNQPVIGTEMGSTVTTRGEYLKDTVRGYVPDQDITAPWWASKAEEWWPIAANHPWFMGGFIWTGFDYRGEPTPYEWPDISSNFGMMDVCGFPKNIYYYYQSWWTDKDVLHLSPHWNWKGKEGQPIDVWVNSNADNVELFLNGKSLGKKNMPRNSHLNWSVPYEPGTLSAIAYKHGKKITAKVETTGAPYEVVMTPYKTTMVADNKDATVVNISVIDKQGREVPDADNLISLKLSGQAKIIGVGNGNPSSHEPDQIFDGNWQRKLFNGKCQVIIQTTGKPGVVSFDATAGGLIKASTTIVTVPEQPVTVASKKRVYPGINQAGKKPIGKMNGADISFLPQLEDRGMKFSDKGVQKDAIEILKDHGINYIRLRIFNDPAESKGYSPKKGFCDLAHTELMAKRIKKAGLKFLLDFHYSDYWADPQQQNIPAAWKDLNFADLQKALHDYTKNVLLALKAQGTLPDMIQVGNEINHGMVWPDGEIGKMDNLADLLKAGVTAVNEVDPTIPIMLHIALGGQNDEARFFLDNMLARGVQFDVVGLSYYPQWHGSLVDLQNNLDDLAKHYKQDLIVVEYSRYKKEVYTIVNNVPNNKGKGLCIWEPLSTWEAVFDKDGKANKYLSDFDEMR